MKFDFTTIIDRSGHDSIAADGLGGGTAPDAPQEGWNAIPMWVADMGFATCPAVSAAMIERAKHGVYGYFNPSEAYYNAIIQWHAKRNNVHGITAKNIGYENGVLGGLMTAMQVLCAPGDKVLVHSPTYVGFTRSLENAGYKIVSSPLVKDEEQIWRMDLADMEEKIIANDIHTMVFCSPHNPTGRVWERMELKALADLCRKHDVYIVSDEIWSDLLLDDHRHIPLQSISEDSRNRTIALYAPSKTFNLAGLIGSYHIIYNQRLKSRMDRQAALCHYNQMNVMSMHALIAAYSQDGMEWLEQLREVLSGNIQYACDFIGEHFEGVTVSRPQGTYLLYLDCTDWCRTHEQSLDQLLKAGWDVGVAWQDGRPFHGPCHIRMNLALPLSQVQEAFRRLKEQVFC